MNYYITDFKVPSSEAVALEDSIMVKGSPVAAGSKILDGFKAPFDAEVVTRLADNGIKIAGKTKMNEFGIAAVSSDHQEEASGAVKAVASDAAKYALCNDVFGQNRRHAAGQGVCYIHPAYGTVSRYGLIPLVSSMDQIGIVCKDLSEGFNFLSRIAGKDEKDGAMLPDVKYTYENSGKNIKVGLPESIINQADESAQASIKNFAGKFDKVNIDLPYFDVYKQVMYILSCAEISNNLSRYDGIKFGYRSPNYKSLNELYVNTRTEGFGLRTKLAAIMGCMALSQDQYEPYYEKAMKIRRLIKESLRFDEYDIIALPTSIGDDPYVNLSLYALAPLSGRPSVSFPYQGHGIMLITKAGNESALLTAWEKARL